jgi:hypothetical protein
MKKPPSEKDWDEMPKEDRAERLMEVFQDLGDEAEYARTLRGKFKLLGALTEQFKAGAIGDQSFFDGALELGEWWLDFNADHELPADPPAAKRKELRRSKQNGQD